MPGTQQSNQKNREGLVLLICSQNDALFMKFLDKFYNNADIPWVKLTWSKLYSNDNIPPQCRAPVGSFWWKDTLKLFDKFKNLATCQLNKHNTVLFWSDIWVDHSMKDKYPQLFSFARKPKCLVRFFLSQSMDRVFYHSTLSPLAVTQLEEVHQIM